jgi:DNA-binding NtrC family response regulator
VVDDEAAWRTILETDLRLLGYNVVLAPDSDRAMEVALTGQAEIAVIDLMLPEPIDGHALLARLRDAALTFPVIFYTAYPVFPSDEHEDEPGVLGYISKSTDRADLYALIPPAVVKARRTKGRRQ